MTAKVPESDLRSKGQDTIVAVNRFSFNYRHLISTLPNVSEDGVDNRVVAFVSLFVAVQNGTFRPEGVAPLPLVVHVGPADYLAAEVKSELLRQLETKMCLVVVIWNRELITCTSKSSLTLFRVSLR